MRFTLQSLLGVFLGSVLLLVSCNEPTIVGEELLVDDRSEVLFTDDLPFKARSIPADSVITYSPLAPLSVYLCGNYQDPFMGKARATVYAQLGLSSLFPEFTRSDNIQLKEAELLLAVDTSSIYGNPDQKFRLNVSRLAEPLEPESTYYASQTFNVGPVLAKHEFIPVWADSLIPLISIPMPASLGQSLLDLDSIVYTSNELFQTAFEGLVLEAGKETSYMLALNLNSSLSGLRLSYVRNDTIDESYIFSFSGSNARMVSYQHDYSGTLVEEALMLDAPSDTVTSLFSQGMRGVNVEFELPDVSSLEGAIINKAEMTLYSRFPNEGTFPLLFQFLALKDDGTGSLELIRDVSLSQATDIAFFGGTLELDGSIGVYKYTFNLSAHLQDVVDGVETGKFVITSAVKPQTAGRTVFYGPGSSVFSPELKVTYTRRN
jgi:hypothetical protein